MEPQQMMPPQMQPQMMVAAPAAVPAGDIFGPGPIRVEQQMSLAELVGGLVGVDIEAANKYDVFGAAAGRMFMHEESNCLERQCCRGHREMDMYLRFGENKQGPQIIRVHKNRHCGGPYDCCCRLTADIFDSGDNLIGSFYDEQCAEWCCRSTIQIKDGAGEPVLKQNTYMCQCGLCFPCNFCYDVEFSFEDAKTGTPNGGTLVKKAGSCKEYLTNANNFELNFHEGATVNEKTMYLAMVAIVDILFFEGGDEQGGGN